MYHGVQISNSSVKGQEALMHHSGCKNCKNEFKACKITKNDVMGHVYHS